MGAPFEASLQEIEIWLEEQMLLLGTPAQRLVLWYLATHSFRREDNPEGGVPGQVLAGYTPLARIRRGTGLGDSTVRYALEYLQANGYIIAEMVPGHGKSRIFVYWTDKADDMRADYRAGIKPLMKAFQRKTTDPVKTEKKQADAVILQFPKRQNLTE